MIIVEIKDKQRLNDFLGAQPHAEFLQSWEWGEFQEKVEGKIIRLGVEENGELIAAATLVKKTMPLGMNYFYCPRGPVIRAESREQGAEMINFFFAEIERIAQKEKVIFLRFEPLEQFPISNFQFPIFKTIDIQVSKTIILDLNLSEDDLLKNMHQKTRYNIRLAEKKGVKIREAEKSPLERGGAAAAPGCVMAEEFDKFWNLMSATVNRDGFRLHSKEYYQKMLSLNGGLIKLFFGFVPRSLGEGGEFEGKIICAGIFSFFGDTAVYLHGASANENRELMAPHLLQWEMIKLAKAAGCKFYDFSGIDEKKWPGVTRFKRGFAGQEMNYPGTFDVIFDKQKYSAYKIFRKIRRLIK
ncbi:MAG: peptidoglycan bridge formation glycyltransferase FemA/FemB family protein [Patescibacteria group bacterium]|nr:peptidoglycan bridge formation glycyltransferase FemA/FemB family protein [Patescibacteria group bacterium]